MRRALATIACAALLAGGASFAELAEPAQAAVTIRLGDNFFDPDRKRVRKGTLVRFRWIGNNRHNVTKVSGPGRNFASATTRERGINFRKRFRRAGRYQLVCTIHSGMDMRLRVRRP